jgi:hypothetical protein
MNFPFSPPSHFSADKAARSPHWPAFRRMHLRLEPTCRWCGGSLHLEVHHIAPFHLHPELELDPGNLITLCESPAIDCHLVIGHFDDWHTFNPHVRRDCERSEFIDDIPSPPPGVVVPPPAAHLQPVNGGPVSGVLAASPPGPAEPLSGILARVGLDTPALPGHDSPVPPVAPPSVADAVK